MEMVLAIRLCKIVSVDEMLFGFMPEGGTIYLEKDARRVSCKRIKVVYVFCGPVRWSNDKSQTGF